MELLEAKICAMISLFLGSMLIGLIPALFSSYGRNRYPLVTSSLLCFGGGVLLATSLIHMLPEVRQNLKHYGEYTELMFCVGFFVLYLIDELVHFCFGKSHHHSPLERSSSSYEGLYTASENVTYGHQSRQPPYNPQFNERSRLLFNERGRRDVRNVTHSEHTQVNSYGLLVALSIHAILEGSAVGLEGSSSQVLLMLGAIASHKLVVSFCLGTELSSVPGDSMLRHFISIVIFSVGTSLGIGLGMSFTEIPENIVLYLLPGLQCLAGGTLLYVSVSEVLPRERAKWHDGRQNTKRGAGLTQFISVLLGFVIMSALSKYMDA